MSAATQYLAHVARIPADRLATYNCPGCGEALKAIKPQVPGDVYDSLTICPFCDARYFKEVDATGSVKVRTL